MKINSTQIPIYFINLERSVERRHYMESTLRSFGLDATRVDAVDGRTADLTTLDDVTFDGIWKRTLTPGEIGCFLSHRKVWKDIAAKLQAYAVVLEDDIKISKNARNLLSSPDWVPSATDCIKLDTNDRISFLTNTKKLPELNYTLSEPAWDMRGTAGYLISLSAAKLLLQKTQVISAPIDVQMFNLADHTYLGLAYKQCEPAIFIQQAFVKDERFLPENAAISEITVRKVDRSRMPFGPRKILRELGRPFRPMSKKLKLLAMSIRLRAKPRDVLFDD